MPKGFIIAIDGPAGAGKSTVSRRLAQKLQGRLLDTGATYRSVAYIALKNKTTSPSECIQIARSVSFSWDRSGLMLKTQSKNLGSLLRTRKVSQMSSSVAKIPGVRKALTSKQRQLARKGSRFCPVIVEGRDIGTVVFPQTPYKFFITASAQVRAKRRYEELKAKGTDVSFKKILKEQIARDRQDSRRKHAPLKRAKGAKLIDTSSLEISEVVNKIISLLGS